MTHHRFKFMPKSESPPSCTDGPAEVPLPQPLLCFMNPPPLHRRRQRDQVHGTRDEGGGAAPTPPPPPPPSTTQYHPAPPSTTQHHPAPPSTTQHQPPKPAHTHTHQHPHTTTTAPETKVVCAAVSFCMVPSLNTMDCSSSTKSSGVFWKHSSVSSVKLPSGSGHSLAANDESNFNESKKRTRGTIFCDK